MILAKDDPAGRKPKMKAIRIHRLGGPDVMSLDDVAAPEPGTGEVLIDIHAASINPADWKVREGFYKDAPWFKLPHCPGRDFSGVISALGAGVTDLAIGDEVFGVTDQGQEGAYAEKIAMKATIVAHKPKSLSHAESAAIALGALTAMVSLEDTAHVASGETVLIQGGAGGVGAMGVQLAKLAGATVIATARGSNIDYVKSLGADQVINYETEDFTKTCPPCDLVFDTVGGAVQPECCKVLKKGGRLAWISRGPKDFKAPEHITVLRPDVRRDRAHLERIARLADEGALRPPAITQMSLAEAAAAQERRKARQVQGKVVLVMR
jgi:NADPH:quinone reductase-like Zn-dependent oxidoreductase